MSSFFAPDYDEQPSFSCAECRVHSTVRSGGGVLLSLMRAQAERCIQRGHAVTTVNFELEPEGQDSS